jgi:hypothetical protein
MRAMKKTAILIWFMSMLILTADIYAAQQAGKVLAVKKDVYVIREEARNNAAPQMELRLKDSVETEKDSRTKLFFSDDSILNLGELSRVKVEEYLYSPENQRSKSIYNLLDGSLKVVVGRSDLEVHTATAVAAARGTKFVVWTAKGIKQAEAEDKLRQTCVMTMEGSVEFKLKKEAITDQTKRDSVIVNEGMISCLEGVTVQDATPAEPKILSKLSDEFPVLGPPDTSPPVAFAPEPVIEPGIPQIPDIPQEPAVSAPGSSVNVIVVFP